VFERFDDGARRAIAAAQDEARLLGHNYIGTEHILLGLAHAGEGAAAAVLDSCGMNLAAVRRQVEEIIGRGKQASSGRIPFTPPARQAVELSLREALQHGDNFIGTEHILLALIRQGDGVAVQVMRALGAEPGELRRQVLRLMHGQPAGGG
jgi:ATP-dependent Clp protease ATP-binding subunit ClpC